MDWETPTKGSRHFRKPNNLEETTTTTTSTGDPNNNDPVAVLFIPRTWNGELAKRLREDERYLKNMMKEGIKIVEKPGTSLKNKLWSADPWGGIKCQDTNCKVCKEGQKKQIYNISNVAYTNTCLLYKEQGQETKYIGESSRTLKERGREHHLDAKNDPEHSHIAVHQANYHPGLDPRTEFNILKVCRTAFERQVREFSAIKILAENRRAVIPNVKTNFNRCWIPTVTVDQRPAQEGIKTPEITDRMIEEYLSRKSKLKRNRMEDSKRIKMDNEGQDPTQDQVAPNTDHTGRIKDAGSLSSGKPGSTLPLLAPQLLGYLPTPGLKSLEGESGSPSPRDQSPPNDFPPSRG